MQTTQTILLQGGLDLVTPQAAMPPGRVISCLNYEPDVNGYTSTGGYERYSGKPSPSDGLSPDDIAARRAAIAAVPGTGPVRGVAVYNSAVWAFRDQNDGSGAMFKATPTGWVQQTFGYTLVFNTGTAAFTEGTVVTGGTSGATATVQRIVVQSGAWDGSAAGFLVLSGVTGTFSAAETISGSGGSAKAGSAQAAITLQPGGTYEFVTHNFYGAAKSLRLYFANGVGTAFEWDGTVLAPIKSGTSISTTFSYLLQASGLAGDRVLAADGVSRIIMGSDDVDNPAYIDEFRNHLFLGYSVGALVFSGPGLPLDYRTIAGAGTFAFGDDMTGMLSVASSLVVYGRGLIEYVAGNSVDDFQKLTITAAAGAVLRTPQVFGTDQIYLDDAGLRLLSSSANYGDFETGTATQLLQPLFKQKRLANIVPTTSLIVTAKDQYRLYWDDGSGVVLYNGRVSYGALSVRVVPETLPFKMPVAFFSSCIGEIQPGNGDRLFAGGTDGYVYELDKGTSFDGATIDTYLRLPFNTVKTPTQNKVFHKFTADVLCQDAISIGVKFDIDYEYGLPGALVNEMATPGTPIISTALYNAINWAAPVQGQVSHYLYGFGRNAAVTLVTSAADKARHTFPSSTLNFSPRGLVR